METDQKILSIVQTILSNSPSHSDATLLATLKQVGMMFPGHLTPEKEQALLRELQTRYNIFVPKETILSNEIDHVAWLNASRKAGWAYWGRYRQFLEQSWVQVSVNALDKTTDRVLEQLEDPKREGVWDRRGLVVGHVQSGKTANYTGLICKAADAGYRFIIVLAGIHSNLRSQTQIRLDEGFLGYESGTKRDLEKRYCPVGVGTLNALTHLRPLSITNRAEQGDFKKLVAQQFNVPITPGSPPILFVVKKNATVLKHLLDYVHWLAGRKSIGDKKTVQDVPLLVIDDEADNASVDTKVGVVNEYGKPDPDHDPTSINRTIRRLLMAFDKRAYVGYTATPFANILIHEQGTTKEEGPDLFPSAFILNIPSPSNYAGPVRIFGLNPDDADDSPDRGLGLVRHVDDTEDSIVNGRAIRGWMPSGHKMDHRPLFEGEYVLPPSARQAIQAFLLVCAARRVRTPGPQFNSMLLHVTRFTNVQDRVREQVETEVRQLQLRLRYGEGQHGSPLMDALRQLWETDFEPTTHSVAQRVEDPKITRVSFDQLMPQLLQAAEDIKVKTINGQAGDVLEYEQHKALGYTVIVVGGDKLARGLTLEGLSVSYFLRASRMYDTLMQMGRWFGYRPGYLDLCRLYCSTDLEEWYQRITEASEELREEFERMALSGETPRNYGLKVESHPSLMVTSSVKMRNSRKLQISYAGNLSESVSFDRVRAILQNNWDCLTQLVSNLGQPQSRPIERTLPNGKVLLRWQDALYWQNVSGDKVLAFFDPLKTHNDAPRSNSVLLANYIREMQAQGELLDWSVALLPGSAEKHVIAGHSVKLVRRSKQGENTSRYSIRRVLSPKDESIDLEPAELEVAWQLTQEVYEDRKEEEKDLRVPTFPAGIFARQSRSSTRGLLLLYPLSYQDQEGGMLVDAPIPVVGFGVSFPGSKHARSITYVVNNVYAQQELGLDYDWASEE